MVAVTVFVFKLMTETEQPVLVVVVTPDGPAQGRLGLPPLTT